MEKRAPALQFPPPPIRAVLWCALLAGCLTGGYAAYCIHSAPCFVQHAHPLFPALDVAALPHRLLGCSKVQVAAAALALLLPAPGRARQAVAFVALAAGVASLFALMPLGSLLITYHCCIGSYGALTFLALHGAGGILLGMLFSPVVYGFSTVLWGEE